MNEDSKKQLPSSFNTIALKGCECLYTDGAYVLKLVGQGGRLLWTGLDFLGLLASA